MPTDAALIVALPLGRPAVDPAAWVAPGATLTGAATLGPQASIWYSAVVRADMDAITVGARTNIQDGAVLHADPGFPVRLGAGVSVGHRAVLHGCTVEDDVLVGMGAVIMNGARVGKGALIAAGAVVLEGAQIPPGSLVAGMPAKVLRLLSAEEQIPLRANADNYCTLARTHAGAG